jgi:hypothetical protein
MKAKTKNKNKTNSKNKKINKTTILQEKRKNHSKGNQEITSFYAIFYGL